MKFILSILLIATLTGCSLSAGDAAKKIGSGVKKTCASLCISPSSLAQERTVLTDVTPVSPVILFEQPGHLLTW
jgi:hypothetical protein